MNLHDEKILRQQLTFVYRVIVSTANLLSEAIELIDISDEFGESLYMFYQKHWQEEKDHAAWLLEDLGGVDLAIDWTAVCLAGSQYYLIKHVHPAVLLGYMQALEVPAPLSLIDELEEIHGKKLLRTWRHHAEVDGKHGEEIANMIIMAPPFLKQCIEQNRQATLLLWSSAEQRFNNG